MTQLFEINVKLSDNQKKILAMLSIKWKQLF